MNERTKGDCGEVAGLQLEVTRGDVPCEEVRGVAEGYDLEGAKVQEINGWTCEGGEAATRPIVFTCIRDEAEFVAKEK